MSGIYIKGMEMPKSCLNCFLSRSECRAVLKRMRAMEAGARIPSNYRHDVCPLVPVPPHGDLIDRDALIKELEITEEDDHNGATLLMAVFLEVLKSAPTIIPAEEGE